MYPRKNSSCNTNASVYRDSNLLWGYIGEGSKKLQREEMQKIGYEFTQTGHTEEIYLEGNFTAAVFERRQVINSPVPVIIKQSDSSAK